MDTLNEVKQTVIDAAKGATDTVIEAAKNTRDFLAEGVKDAKEMVLDVAGQVKDTMQGTQKCDVLDVLKMDHETVSGFFEQIESLEGDSLQERESLFAQLKYELETHAEVEERLFYPTLEKGEEPRLMVRDAFDEHELVRQLLTELSTMPMGTQEWLDQLRVLKENVDHHVQVEEDEFFDYAREFMSAEQRQNLGVRFQQTKKLLATGNGASPKTSTKSTSQGTDRGARGAQAKRSPRKTLTKRSSRSTWTGQSARH